MAIDWSHLPSNVLSQLCMDSIGNQEGYALDRATGYWVHSKASCRKPSINTLTVQECDICEKPFHPKTEEEASLSFMGSMCDDCK
jgi:hypothetical protein